MLIYADITFSPNIFSSPHLSLFSSNSSREAACVKETALLNSSSRSMGGRGLGGFWEVSGVRVGGGGVVNESLGVKGFSV